MKIEKIPLEKNFRHNDVHMFILKGNETEVTVTNYGGIISSIKTPNKDGKYENITLGFENTSNYLDEYYVANNPYFGAIIGRYANRLANGIFHIGEKEYQLDINNGPNHLHGGLSGFDKKVWSAKSFERDNEVGVEMSYLSPHMEEGYPGNLNLKVTYSLNNMNELKIDYQAETDAATIINLTNHTYFNLNPVDRNILNHDLVIFSNEYTESNELIPTGKYCSVEGTPFDFRSVKKIKTDIDTLSDGYDLNFVLNNTNGELKKAAKLTEEKSGRKVEVFTTQPGIQLYTGYYIPEFNYEGEKRHGRYSGVALETQHYPDSPNHPDFPSTQLNPGEKFGQQTVYKFGLA